MAKAIEFKDRLQNVGASLVKSVASSTNDVAGDGICLIPVDCVNLVLMHDFNLLFHFV